MRQLGGSFGTAVLNTYIVNMTAYHRAEIVAKLHPGDAALTCRRRSGHFCTCSTGQCRR